MTLLSLVLHGQVRRLAAAEGVSMGDWVAQAVRERVERDADAGDRPGVGRAAVADGSRSGFVASRSGADAAGVGPRGAESPVDPFTGLSMQPPAATLSDTVSQWADPWEGIA